MLNGKPAISFIGFGEAGQTIAAGLVTPMSRGRCRHGTFCFRIAWVTSSGTLCELGVEPLMTAATVKRQRKMGELGSQQSVRAALNADRAAMLGAISAAARDRH